MHMQMESNGCIYLPFWIYYMQIVFETNPVNQIICLLGYSESRSPPWAKHDDSMGTCEQIKLINIGFKF